MREAYYTTDSERGALLDEATAKGEFMLHDDFLPDGSRRLTFDWATASPEDPLLLEWKSATTIAQKVTVIAKRMGLES